MEQHNITNNATGRRHDSAMAVADQDPSRTQISHEQEPIIGMPYSQMNDEKRVTPTPSSETEAAALTNVPLEDGEEHPTEEDLNTLRRVSDKIPFKAYTIAFVELTERMSFYGTTQVFVNFISKARQTPTGAARDPYGPNPHPGALGLGPAAATRITTFNQFWCYLLPLLGAYVADTYWGRMKTIWIAVMVAVIGHTVLVVSALPSVLDTPKNSLGAFMIGILIMGIGTGGFKPNISPLIAEQMPHETMVVRTTKKGERVIVDPSVTYSRVYNWFYLFINIGSLVGQLSMVTVERYYGFYLAYLIPTVTFATIVPGVLFVCRNWYKKTPPSGSILGPAVKMLFLGAKGRWSLNPITTYKKMNDGTFWEKVKPSSFSDANRPKWMTFDDQWVDELRRGYSACTVFLWYPLYWLTYNQLNNNLTNQANTMELHGITSDVISNLDPFTLILLIPFCDLVMYPWLRKRKIRFTPIKRITAGFLLGAASMIYTLVVQYYIYKLGACGSFPSGKDSQGEDCPPAPVNVWVQTPAYILIAISEIFASITGLEYAFSKAPKNMRSLVMSFFLFMSAISSAIGQAFTPLSADPLLIWNYGSAGVLSLVGGLAFWFTFRNLDAMEDQLNELPAGHAGTRQQGDLEQEQELKH